MSETAQQIEARLRATYPTISERINGVSRTLSQAAYDARIADMVQFALDAQDAAAAEQARLALRRKYRWARNRVDEHLPIITGPPAPTAAQVRNATRDMLMMWDGLLEVLHDARTILDNDET